MTTLDEKEANARKDAEHTWYYLGGSELEPYLESGAIALVNASWLVEYASANSSNVITYRQRLQRVAPDAFLSLDEIRSATREGPYGGLKVIALSYMWLHPSHPDPKGTTLRTVAAMLESFLKDGFPCWGVLWDYASLYQKRTGQLRSQHEEQLFQEGLRGLSIFYSHPETYVFKVTKLPDGYPNGYELPDGANQSPYSERGWPLADYSWASMTKNSLKTLDIRLRSKEKNTNDISKKFSETRVSRGSPLVPSLFNEEMDKCSFTNKKEDSPLVKDLYEQSFVRLFSGVTMLDYSGLQWKDKEVVRLAKILSNYTPRLERLKLSMNHLGAPSCYALADSLLPQRSPLKVLVLSRNPDIGDKGIAALENVIVMLEHVELEYVGISDSTCAALLDAATKNGTKLVHLDMSHNQIGDEGFVHLANLAKSAPSMKKIEVKGNPASKESFDSLSESLRC